MVGSIQSSQKNQKSAAKNALEKLSNGKISLSTASQLLLLTELQSTLDLKTLLTLFLRHLNTFIAVDGLHYQEEQRQLSVKIGRQSVHSCGYRLIEDARDHGEIVLMRSKRFSSSELELVESLVICLLAPITNALQYSDAVKLAVNDPSHHTGGQLLLAESLDREIELAKRHNHPLSMIMIRIHSNSHRDMESLAGEVVGAMEHASRNTDRLFRTEKNCIVLLLHKADGSSLSTVMNRLGARLALSGNNNNSLQLDFGMATLTGTDSLTSMMDRAEKSIGQ